MADMPAVERYMSERNEWFVHSLGRGLGSHQYLKQSADHIVLLHNEVGGG